MKKILVLLSLILTVILFNSCEKELDTEIVNVKESLLESDRLKLESLGYNVNIEEVIDKGEFYIVEGDIIVDKENLRSAIQTRQARFNNIISYRNQRAITVFIDGSIPTDNSRNNWRSEIGTAINHWNSIANCNINMTLVSNSNADIRISGSNFGSGNGNTLAMASEPINGKPGPTISINYNYSGGKTMTSSQKIYNMVHELGHCLGLRHTNWAASDFGQGGSGIGIGNTPNSGSNPDPNSIMNGGTAENSWNGFSNYDLVAIRTLYPTFSVSLFNFPYAIPTAELNKTMMIAVNSSISVSELTYSWSFRGGILHSGQGTSTVTVAPGSPVTFGVTVKVTTSTGERATIDQNLGQLRPTITYQ